MNIDKQLVRQRFGRNLATYHEQAVVQRDIADTLASALLAACPALHIRRAMEIGIGTGFLTRHLLTACPEAEWYLNDITPEAFRWIDELGHPGAIHYHPGDAETIPYPENIDLIATSSAVQWFDDIPTFLAKAHAALTPGGILAVSTFGPENFVEIRRILNRGLEYPTLETFRQWASQTGYRILHAHDWTHRLTLGTPLDVLRHIKKTGVNGTQTETWNRCTLADFHTSYHTRYADPEGNVPISYHPIVLILQK